jgi:ATPase subunit of ABC transporter with duplicated ATPase domains
VRTLKSGAPIIQNFALTISGPEHVALIGNNGSGKTTLVKLILGELPMSAEKIYLGVDHVRYLDQHTKLLVPELSILENFLRFNPDIGETDARFFLAQFLFRNVTALKRVTDLSGGEKLRAALACALLSNYPPQLLILDEPTNHLDITSITCIESALKNYKGALLVISHDQTFLKNVGIMREISAPFKDDNT